ncbi:NADH-quinone oxidoreductase subunit H [Streptomyces sp. ISL-36]|uniref:NADH-quinone oxidoreductase subunit H n=1 Tax=Streptomyces sp. ISL-36 TaxID=2819182 RepID=UPI001BE9F671|nr:NADH-quinone oxidoreductase subunit H [Streptomyces sp. ISL-36]MBT2444350.1 NADH-quinone oxidoreductase subunit H [Streptomyces sp. ISL-36]
MAETAPLWAVLLMPLALVVLALAAAGFDAVLTSGPSGARQAFVAPLFDVLRLLGQQRRRTAASDSLLGRLGIALVPVAAVLAAAVLPWGTGAVTDPVVGVVWFNAMEALAWAAVWLAGWGPNSALPLFGGYRFLAQGLAYELPHMFALTTAALGAESLRVGDIVAAQRGLWFVVWMPAAFLVYLLSALAMSFWGPFGHPLGRDAAGGAVAEYSGADRLLLLGGRWLLFVVTAAFSVPLFLGGGHGPLLPAWAWTALKTGAVLAALIAARRLMPVLRMERYMEVAWMVLVPLTLVQALVVAVVVLDR